MAAYPYYPFRRYSGLCPAAPDISGNFLILLSPTINYTMSLAAESTNHFVQVIETPTCILGMDEERICHTIFHPDVHITMEEIKLVEQGLIQISENQPFKILFDMRNQYIQFDKDARKHAASAPITKLIQAEAVILNSLPNRLLFNFFLNFDKPSFPIKAFSNLLDALDWLRKY